MSSTSPPPGPPGPSQPEAAPLTMHERDVLSRLAAAEFAADPRFANDLAAGRVADPAGPVPRWVAVLGVLLVAGVLTGLVASAAIVPAVVLAAITLVAGVLVVWARRQSPRR